MCQIRKTRIEIKANLVTYADACKAVKIAVDNWYNNLLDIANNSEDKTDVDFANIDLAQFGIHTKILLADSVRKTCRR